MPMNYGYSEPMKKHDDAGPGSAVTGKPRTLSGNGSGVKSMSMRKNYKAPKKSGGGKKKMTY